MNELPTMSSTVLSGSTYALGDANAFFGHSPEKEKRAYLSQAQAAKQAPLLNQILENLMPQLRIVRVIIVDPTEALPLDSRILYKGDEQVTDLTDQELFYELDIKGLLTAHNAKREKTLDKKLTQKLEKDTYLEPIRVSALKMNVVVVAGF